MDAEMAPMLAAPHVGVVDAAKPHRSSETMTKDRYKGLIMCAIPGCTERSALGVNLWERGPGRKIATGLINLQSVRPLTPPDDRVEQR